MKIVVLKSDLVQAVTNVQKAVSPRNVYPALEGVLIKTPNNQSVELLGYDQELGIRTKINARVIEEGSIVINAKLFSDMVKKLPNEEVTINVNDYMVHIQSGTAEYDVVGINPVEYPELPAVDEKEKFSIQGDLLKEMISQTVYAVSDNQQKPTYTGSLFKVNNNELTIVAIDGYRMAVRIENIDSDLNTEFIVPKKTQQELLKLAESEVNIIIGTRYILFDLGEYRLISRLIEGSFLDYTQTIPKECITKAIVNTEDIINAVDRMSLLCGDKVKSPVIATFDKGIEFNCSSPIGKATEKVNSDVNGDKVTVGFNNRYMLEAVKAIESDKVLIELSGELKPMLIKPIEGNSCINLVVPMRTSK